GTRAGRRRPGDLAGRVPNGRCPGQTALRSVPPGRRLVAAWLDRWPSPRGPRRVAPVRTGVRLVSTGVGSIHSGLLYPENVSPAAYRRLRHRVPQLNLVSPRANPRRPNALAAPMAA